MRFWSQNFTEGASPRYGWFSALRPLRILEQIGPLVGQRLVPPCRAFNRWSSVALSADRNVARNRAYEIYLRREIEVSKHQSIGGVGQRRRIARLVVPSLKVGDLGRADAEQDSQRFHAAHSLSQRGG